MPRILSLIFTFLSKSVSSSLIAKHWIKAINYIPKRIRIIIMVLFMGGVFSTASFFPFSNYWLHFIVILAIVTYITTYIAVFEGIDGIEKIILFIMPMLFVVSMYLFYSLFPVRWLTRIPFLFLFCFGYYAMLLSSNIFNVGAEKIIQLYRAAFSINYLFQALVIYIFSLVISSFKLNFLLTSAFIGGVMMIASIQILWSVRLQNRIDKNTVIYSASASLILIEFMILLSFAPLASNIFSLIVTTAYYSIMGILTNHVGDRLYKNVVREYIFVFIFVVFISFLTVQW